MDSVIISAIITGIASAIVAMISLRAGRAASIPNAKEIRYQQLTELFEPIEQVFLTASNPDNAIKEIYSLMTSNIKLVPPFLLEEVSRVKAMSSLTWDSLRKLYTMNNSLYNWHCRHFGYSYNSERIIKKYTPVYTKQMLIKYIAPYVSLALSAILSLISALLALYSLSNSGSGFAGLAESLSFEEWIAVISLSFSLFLIMFQSNKR